MPAKGGKMLSWAKAIDRHPAGHLITGVYRYDGQVDRLELLQRLVAAMPATGDWASRTSSDRGEDIVQVVFEQEADAVRLGDTLGARRSGAYPGWKSQRVFGFPLEMAQKIEKVLAAVRIQ